MLVDEVDGAAGDFYSVLEGLCLGVEAGEGRQEGWVDVEDLVGECGYELGTEQAEVAGQNDEIDIVIAEGGKNVGVMLCAFAAFGDVKGCMQA
jgi:hypothetical protein